MKKFFNYWLPVIFWAGVIFYLSGVSGLASNMTVFWDVFWRKLFHAGEFGLLNLLLWRVLYYGENVSFKKALLRSLLLTVLYAASDEFHQYFVPLREARWKDVMQDCLGALAVSFVLLLSKYKNILTPHK
ncbi:MAG: VanZ family protein [Candidatus Portnoybacteria bacterium]|nr:VanZ family protein [Candidatus Portnoybacteria bacterium]MDD4982665.1 VanZ family protein [Candidatus Portnoybacteria bacterium]